MVHPASRVAACLLAAAMFALCALPASAAVVPGEVIVRFAPGQRAKALDRAGVKADGIRPLHDVRNAAVIELAPGQTVKDSVADLAKAPGVVWAQPNGIRRLRATPNDPRFLNGSQWGMQKIDAPGAWDLITDARPAVVAVVDDGISQTHSDLDANIWHNPGEIPGNGIDDDGDGFVDDVTGWNFEGNNNNTQPKSADDDHGTHVAGIIGAEGNNGIGVAGLAWQSSLMGLDVFDADTTNGCPCATDADIVDAFAYAGARGARVVNASLGGGGDEPPGYRSVISSYPNTMYVVAAGNEGDNNDSTPDWPCNFDLVNVVCVAASDQNDNRATWSGGYSSNYGATTVDLAAPGSDIWSTVPGGYAAFDGTSMATPHVSGVLALMFARTPGLTGARARQALFCGVDRLNSFTGLVATGGRLNARAALAEATDASAPNAFGLRAPNDGGVINNVRPGVVWDATQDDVRLERYDIVIDGTVAATAGPTATGVSLTRDLAEGTHSVAVRAVDCMGNTTSTAPTSVTVDTTAPGPATAQGPAAGQAVNVRRPRLTWNAASDANGVDLYEVSVDGGAPTVVGGGLGMTVPADLPDGQHSWTIRAIDRAGNRSAATSTDFLVDTVPPASPVTTGPGKLIRDRTPELQWSAPSDVGSGVARYEVLLDNKDVPTAGRATTLQVQQTLTSGSHAFLVWAVDAAGNFSLPADGRFTIDASRPVLTARASSAGAGRVRVRCSADETVRCAITVLAPARLAKRLQLGSKTATLGRTSTKAAGHRTVIVKLTARARRALRRSGPVTARVRVTATDLAGNHRTRSLRVRIR